MVKKAVVVAPGSTSTLALCVSRSELSSADEGMADTLLNAYGNSGGSVMPIAPEGTG